MAEKPRMQAPAGMAGLQRFQEDLSKFKIKPETVIGICVGVGVLEIIVTILL